VSAVSTFDGRRLRAIGRSGVVHELDMATGGWSPVANGALGFGGPATTSISPDGRTVAGWDGRVVRLRSLDDGQAVEHEVRSERLTALFAWNAESSRVACIFAERVIILDTEHGRIAEGSVQSGFLRCASWTGPNDIVVGSTLGEHRVNLLQVKGDRVELVKEGPAKLHFDWIGDRIVEFSPGGPVNIYPVGGFERIRGEIERSLVGHTDAASACAISPDGAWIATGGADTMIRIWNLANGDCYLPLAGAEATVQRLRWSPDGGALIAIDQRGHVRYFDSVPRRERVTSGRG
jgi:WD40 repeat protein